MKSLFWVFLAALSVFISHNGTEGRRRKLLVTDVQKCGDRMKYAPSIDRCVFRRKIWVSFQNLIWGCMFNTQGYAFMPNTTAKRNFLKRLQAHYTMKRIWTGLSNLPPQRSPDLLFTQAYVAKMTHVYDLPDAFNVTRRLPWKNRYQYRRALNAQRGSCVVQKAGKWKVVRCGGNAQPVCERPPKDQAQGNTGRLEFDGTEDSTSEAPVAHPAKNRGIRPVDIGGVPGDFPRIDADTWRGISQRWGSGWGPGFLNHRRH